MTAFSNGVRTEVPQSHPKSRQVPLSHPKSPQAPLPQAHLPQAHPTILAPPTTLAPLTLHHLLLAVAQTTIATRVRVVSVGSATPLGTTGYATADSAYSPPILSQMVYFTPGTVPSQVDYTF